MKATLIFLVTLTVGIATSLGQVSYVSVGILGGYNLLANPLSAGATNGADEIMTPIDGELILTWEGRGFVVKGYDLAFGGWVDADTVTPSSPPSLPPGKGFFFFQSRPCNKPYLRRPDRAGPGHNEFHQPSERLFVNRLGTAGDGHKHNLGSGQPADHRRHANSDLDRQGL